VLLCGGTLEVDEPGEVLRSYVDSVGLAYDTLVTNGSAGLVDGDLLAPVLLGVHLDAPRFLALRRTLPDLSERMAELPPVPLAEADDGVIAQVAALFTVIDELGRSRVGVRGSIVAKVLHRKRPDLIPLYDTRVWSAYADPGPVPRVRERSWVDYMVLLCGAMRDDLRAEAAAFEALAAAQPRLTPLRILDILVWMSSEPPV
jgi:hypothetical protein